MNNTDKTIHELTASLRKADDTVNKLTEVLEKSERRSQSAERRFRWMGAILLGLGMIMVSYTGSNYITQAQAQSHVESSGHQTSELSLPPEIKEFLHNLNGMVKNMNNLSQFLSLEDWEKNPPENLTKVVEKLLKSDPNLQEELQKVEEAGGGAITYLFVEAAKGLGQLDDLKGVVGGIMSEIKFINQQMLDMNNNMSDMNKNMNGMNNNMLEMNRNMYNMSVNMSVMSRDMDSTMGRMGRMMPGGPGGWW